MLQAMATIGIDCRFADVRAGLGTYTRELVTELAPLLSGHRIVLFVRKPDSLWLRSLGSSVEIVEAPCAPYSLAEQTALPNAFQDAKLDLLFVPHFNVPLFTTIPFICTVHDLILHKFPGNSSFLKRMAYRFVLSRALRHARAVLTISEATKKDIAGTYGKKIGAKTHVIYPGVSETFSPRSKTEQDEVRARYRLESPYLFYVGGCKEHKNVATLIDAFQSAGLGNTELVLIAGGPECRHLKRAEHIRFLTDVRDEDFPALYSAALGSVTATKAEGFYFPAVEAMACACPVLATNVWAVPEVSGAHALLVEPIRDMLADGMRKLISDPLLRSDKKLKEARDWAARYSWKKAAARAKEILETV